MEIYIKLLLITIFLIGCGEGETKKADALPETAPGGQETEEVDESFVLIPVNDKRSLPFTTLTTKVDFKIGEQLLENGKLINSGEQSGEGVLCNVSAMKDIKAGESATITAITAGDDFGDGNTGIYLSYLSRDQRMVFIDYCVKFGSDRFTLNDIKVGLGEYFNLN